MNKEIKKKIKDLQNKRHKFIIKKEKTYDPLIGQYKRDFSEIQDLKKEIIQLLYTHQKILTMEFIIEQLIMLGRAPNIKYDDNGHFYVTQPGCLNTKMNFTVKKEKFVNNIRSVLRKYMEKLKS